MFWIIVTGIITIGFIPLMALTGFAFDFMAEAVFRGDIHPNEYWTYVLAGLCIWVCVSILRRVFG